MEVMMPRYRLDFSLIDRLALHHSTVILQRWLPGGQVHCGEYVVCNPRREDRHVGSFKINVRNGRWADFATGDGGSGFISLAAYVFRLRPYQAAQHIADMLGMSEACDGK